MEIYDFLTDYAREVARFGGAHPFTDAEGRKHNLRHEPAYNCGSVQTDGQGNILEMDLLPTKSCFGRPEYYLRHGLYRRMKMMVTPQGKECSVRTRCDGCVAEPACAEVVIERLASDSVIGSRFDDFDDAARQKPRADPFASSVNRRLWAKFLTAIKGHGGWTNVNDLRSVVAEQEKRKAAADRKREQRRLREQADRSRFTRKP